MGSSILLSTKDAVGRDEAVMAVTRRIRFVSDTKQWVSVLGRKFTCDMTTIIGLDNDQKHQFVAQVCKLRFVRRVENKEQVVIVLRNDSRIHQDDVIEKLAGICYAILQQERQLTAANCAIVYDATHRSKMCLDAQ
jgi:hypothetical protein